MTLGGRPLLDTSTDAKLFVDREVELGRVQHALAQGFNCVLVGERGIGKTSLVRALMYRVRTGPAGLPPLVLVLVRGAGASEARAVLGRVIEALDGPMAPEVEEPSSRELIGVLGQVAARLDQLPVIVLDDLVPAAGQALFGTLRDELWEVGLQWLVVVSDVDAPVLLRPPADAFFEARVEVGELPATAATELLRRRLPDMDPQVLQGATLISGNPRQLLQVARTLVDEGTDVAQVQAEAVAQRDKLAALGRPARMLFAELQALGSATASDVGLQQRMGWTRSRLVQVLNQLEEHGLVVSSVAADGTPGRPRKVYAPAGQWSPTQVGMGQA